jgi:hypothetical protein
VPGVGGLSGLRLETDPRHPLDAERVDRDPEERFATGPAGKPHADLSGPGIATHEAPVLGVYVRTAVGTLACEEFYPEPPRLIEEQTPERRLPVGNPEGERACLEPLPIAAELLVGDRSFGQVAEALVTVGGERF